MVLLRAPGVRVVAGKKVLLRAPGVRVVVDRQVAGRKVLLVS